MRYLPTREADVADSWRRAERFVIERGRILLFCFWKVSSWMIVGVCSRVTSSCAAGEAGRGRVYLAIVAPAASCPGGG